MRVAAAREGDRAAFGVLYERYARMVHGILLARVPSVEVADLVHDVFLLALRRLHTLREPGAFGGWVAQIARNRANDYHRREPKTSELSDAAADDSAARDSGRAEAQAVLAAIRGLPEAYWETLVLRLVEGITGPEIATRTGLTPASVRVNLHRGMKQLNDKARLPVGQWLETDASSSATLNVDGFGSVEVEPNTRLRLLKANPTEEHLVLERGTIHAQIAAPPYVFLVYTPSAYALDMGCAYTLHVDENGAGILRVTSGWVAFQRGGRQAMVPAGGAAETRPGVGPGAPYFEDASEAFRKGLQTVNFNLTDAQARSAALTMALEEARPRDAFTLLNLFRRVEPADRGRLYDRLAQLLPPPVGTTRQDAVNGDWSRLDPWWDELGLGNVKKGTKGPPRIEE